MSTHDDLMARLRALGVNIRARNYVLPAAADIADAGADALAALVAERDAALSRCAGYARKIESTIAERDALRGALRAMLDDDDHDAAKIAARAALEPRT